MSLCRIISGDGRVVGGRSTIATQPIARGNLILQEDPLVIQHISEPLDNFYEAERDGTTSRLERAVANLSCLDKIAFKKLYRSKPASGIPGAQLPPEEEQKFADREQLVDRFKYNAWSFKATGNKAYLAIYRLNSFINHSCVPNATLDIWQGNSFKDYTQIPKGQARLIATRDIPANSEIFLDYMPHDWLINNSARRDILHTHWGF
jgi:hypothetical protein